MTNWKKGDIFKDINTGIIFLMATDYHYGTLFRNTYESQSYCISGQGSEFLTTDTKIQIQDLPKPVPLWVYDQIGWYE